MSVVTLELTGLSSVDIADCTRLTRESLGPGWNVDEVDRVEDHHSPLDFFSLGLSGLQCALAGVAIWLQIRYRDRDPKSEADEVQKTVRDTAIALGVPDPVASQIIAAIDSSAEKIVIDLPDYRLKVWRRKNGKFEVRGKRRKPRN